MPGLTSRLYTRWPALTPLTWLLPAQSLCKAVPTVENIHPHFSYPPPLHSAAKFQLKSHTLRAASPDEARAPALSPALASLRIYQYISYRGLIKSFVPHLFDVTSPTGR